MKRFILSLVVAAAVGGANNSGAATNDFVPGEIWRDTDGQPINAHGGGLLLHQGVYYWYGELKEGRTYITAANHSWGGTRVVAGGVACYSSTNLLDWRNEGVALPALPDDPAHDLHCEKVLERPKVVFNAKTGKFVLWLHVDSADYKAARAGVAVSDSPRGPFRYLGSFRPNAGVWPANVTPRDKQRGRTNYLARDFRGGQMARDMTLFVDDDGAAYHFYSSEENATMHVSRLTDDYLKPAGKFARIFPGRFMEAPAVFKRGGKYFLFASGCTGWNRTRRARRWRIIRSARGGNSTIPAAAKMRTRPSSVKALTCSPWPAGPMPSLRSSTAGNNGISPTRATSGCRFSSRQTDSP